MRRIIYYIGLHSATGSNVPTRVQQRTEQALDILCVYYDSLNLTKTVGVWRGMEEPSLRVEVIISETVGREAQAFTRAEQAQDIAREIARTLEQDAVGLSIETLDTFQLITKD